MTTKATLSPVPFLVHSDSGVVDLAKSRTKFDECLTTYVARQTADVDLVRSCMTELFDWHRGTNLNTGFIKGRVIAMMSKSIPEVSPGLHAELEKRVSLVLKEDTKAGVYAVKGGPNGGHYRVSDQALAPTVAG